MSAWSKENVELLKTSWTAGHSATEIARALCSTRNAVIGKANRLIALGQLKPRGNLGSAARRSFHNLIRNGGHV